MRMINNSNIKQNLPLLFFILVVLSFLIINKVRINNIKDTMVITSGTIFNSKLGSRGWIELHYEFFLHDQRFQSLEKIGIPNKYYKIFLNKKFPVVHSSENPKINEMLIFPEDFKKYNIEFPDSLNWVLPYNK